MFCRIPVGSCNKEAGETALGREEPKKRRAQQEKSPRRGNPPELRRNHIRLLSIWSDRLFGDVLGIVVDHPPEVVQASRIAGIVDLFFGNTSRV